MIRTISINFYFIYWGADNLYYTSLVKLHLFFFYFFIFIAPLETCKAEADTMGKKPKVSPNRRHINILYGTTIHNISRQKSHIKFWSICCVVQIHIIYVFIWICMPRGWISFSIIFKMRLRNEGMRFYVWMCGRYILSYADVVKNTVRRRWRSKRDKIKKIY